MEPRPDKTATAGSWRCYLLRCADDTLYVGVTNDLARRLREHNAGTAARYTRGRGPVSLLWSEPCRDRSTALRREAQLKRWPRRRKEALIQPPRPQAP